MSDFAGQTLTAHIPYGYGVERPELDDETKQWLIQSALEDAAHAHGCSWESWRIVNDAHQTPAPESVCSLDDDDSHEHEDKCWGWARDEAGRPAFTWAIILKAVAT